MRTTLLRPLVPALLAFLPACTNESEDALASGTFLIGDAPADNLDFFVAQVSSLRLRNITGELSDDFLGEGVGVLHREVDLVRLDGTFQWLGNALADIDPGTYTGVVLGFKPLAYQARTETGVGVTVTSTSDELDVAFPAPLSLGWGSQATVLIDIDLAASLAGDPASGFLTFTPIGTAKVDDGSGPLRVEEFLGELRSFDLVRSTLVVRGTEHGNPLGTLTVHLDAGTLLLDQNDVPQTNASFLLSLPGVVLEIEGFFVDGGEFHATRVETGDFDVVERVEGRVIGLDLANRQMTLGRTQFESDTTPGPELLAALDPIVLGWDLDTTFLLRDPASITDEASLAVGQSVEARVFTYGAGEPVPVTEVEIASLLPTYEGEIVSVAGPTTFFVAELAAHDPAVVSGLVETSTTSVAVDHGGTGIVLATEGEPELDPAELQVGLEFECAGTLSGPPDSPTIQASSVRVLPGWLDDALLGVVSTPNSSFKTTQGELRDPFGPGVTPGPMDVLVAPECVFTGDVTDAASFFALFGGAASPGASLDVFGLGTDVANTIRAYEIRVKTL